MDETNWYLALIIIIAPDKPRPTTLSLPFAKEMLLQPVSPLYSLQETATNWMNEFEYDKNQYANQRILPVSQGTVVMLV